MWLLIHGEIKGNPLAFKYDTVSWKRWQCTGNFPASGLKSFRYRYDTFASNRHRSKGLHYLALLFQGYLTSDIPTGMVPTRCQSIYLWWVHKIPLVVIICTNLQVNSKAVWQSNTLTHWGQVMWIWVGKLTIIGTDNGRCKAIICTNAGILLILTLRYKLQRNFNKNSNIFIEENMFENVVREMLSTTSQPQWVNLSKAL